jgi:WD40 repeat protein
VLGAPFFGAVLPGERQGARVVAFSPEGEVVATGDADGTVWIRRLDEWRRGPRILTGKGVEIAELFLGEHGRWLVTKDVGGQVWRWDLAQADPTPAPVARVAPGDLAVALSQDGRWLASKTSEGRVQRWSLYQPSMPPVFMAGLDPAMSGSSRPPLALAFSSDNHWLATGSRDGQVRIWATDQPEAAPLVLGGKAAQLSAIAFSPDGRQLAAGGEDGRLWWWDTIGPAVEPREMPGAGGRVWSVAISRDGRWLAAASEDWRVRLWSLAQPEAEPTYLTGHMRRVKAVGFSADSQLLASASPDEMVRLWHLGQPGDAPQILAVIAGKKGDGFKALAASPTARLLAAGNQDWSVRVWDLDRPREPPVVLGGREQARDAQGRPDTTPKWVWAVAFSPDGRWLASGSQDGAIRLWEVAALRQSNVRPRRELRGNAGPVRALAFSRDGRWLASGGGTEASDGQDNPVLLWDLDGDDKPDYRLDGHAKAVESVAFSPGDASLLAWASQDGTVRLWRLGARGTPPTMVAILDRLEPGTRALAFSPDGRVLASGSGQTEASGLQAGVVHLWTIGQSDAVPVERGRLNVLGGGVHALTFNPTDSRRLATSSVDGTVWLWHLGQPNASPVTLHGHDRLVRALAFSTDGTLLISGGADDNTIRLWPTTERLAAVGCERVRRNLRRDEWRRFIGADIAYQRTCDRYPDGDASDDAGRSA